MASSDLPEVWRVAGLVHPDYPEGIAVFADRLCLCPAGCLVLADGNSVQGYALGHPWRLGPPPPLDTCLGGLPAGADTFHIHDLALLPAARGHEHGVAAVRRLTDTARRAGLPRISLVAVGRSGRFWRRNGFGAVAGGEGVPGYGAHAVLMERTLPPGPGGMGPNDTERPAV